MDVFSWDLEDLSRPEKFFHLAQAYIDSSLYLFKGLAEKQLPVSYSHTQAAAFLFNHSLELFLKGAISQAGKDPKTTHNLESLHAEFKKLYPDKSFEFSGKIKEVVPNDPRRPHSEFDRYPIDNAGKPWPCNTHFTIEIWAEQIALFRDDYKRLVPLIKDRYK